MKASRVQKLGPHVPENKNSTYFGKLDVFQQAVAEHATVFYYSPQLRQRVDSFDVAVHDLPDI
jgi:hypothetical protein